jgi:hypothetical protein
MKKNNSLQNDNDAATCELGCLTLILNSQKSNCGVNNNGQTPQYEQAGQLVVQHHQRTCWALGKPAPNKLYNLLGADLARAQQVGQQLGSVEFISQQVTKSFV